jgi:hypothetical protein
VNTTATPDRFTTLRDEHAQTATDVALEEHGFSVEAMISVPRGRQSRGG